MFKMRDKFYSSNGKRVILIAEDENINRAILGKVLEDDYEVIYTSDGHEALQKIKENKDMLSLVLLDLMMPVINGLDILRIMREDKELSKIPVIVVTSDQDAEVESLMMGAVDFIPKPYPAARVVQARVLRTIELFEDRQIIRSTERDPITGLYNKEYFYRYAEQYDQHHSGVEMDAIIIDVSRFHIVNDRFGMAYGNEVLRIIGEKAREAVRDIDGIVCRREADTFMIYCPHGADYKKILEQTSDGLSEEGKMHSRIRLRMGVYTKVDKTLEIDRRFDRAKMAADTIRNSAKENIGVYDDVIREKELYSERLIDDFREAIKDKQFKVYYQPKFNIRPTTPVLSSAEALVRWQHPQLGMISPAVFIPLFEDNGLIQELDQYVWRTAAEQIKDFKKRVGYSVPISVNVSRIDLYDPELANILQSIVEENELEPHELLLEITESAYTEDSDRIIAMIDELRRKGFRIEMDDFGTGYSSLNMISALPIDALKLDMKFIRNAFGKRRDTRMIEVIIDIAGYLSVPVIAEGVETEEQLHALKAIGCDLVQGYYFSKPVTSREFDKFLIEYQNTKNNGLDSAGISWKKVSEERKTGVTYANIAQALSRDYFSIYYVDTETDWFVEYSSHAMYQKLGIEKSGEDFFNLSRKNIPRAVHPDDVDMFLSVFTKENIMSVLDKGITFTLTYRLMFGDTPTYVHMKAMRMEDKNDSHIVVGVSKINGADPSVVR